MNIIVVGIGKVGYTISEQLCAEKHDVTIVDINESVLSNANNELDVFGVHGNGATKSVLTDAGVQECDLLIALTGSDEINMLCCLLARKLGARGTIARVRNPEYNDNLSLINDSLGLSMTVNPEREAAAEISRILRFPCAKNIELFARGRIDIASFVADKNCLLCGKTIKDSFSTLKAKALVCAIKRESNVFIPTGDSVIEQNDTLAVLTLREDVTEFFKGIGYSSAGIKNTMIIGGGRIAYYLAAELANHNMDVTIIEKEKPVAKALSYALPYANVICGDGTDRSILLEEGLCSMDALCCLTGFDEENILLPLYAKNIAPKIKTVAKVNKLAFQEVINTLDIGSVIYPKYITSNMILRHVRAMKKRLGNNINALYKIIDNQVEALEFVVGENSSVSGKTLEELNLKNNILIGCIIRDGNIFIPHGQDKMQSGDSVVVVTTITGLSDIDDIEG